MKSETRLKIVVSAIAMAGIVVRLVFPALKIDAVSLGLFVLGVLPWLAPLIKSAELPGGWKIQFQDIKNAAEKITGPSVLANPPALAWGEGKPLLAAQEDPNLALVGLRIEIEKRLRALARKSGIAHSGPLSRLTEELEEEGALDPMAARGLQELITYGNQAAHGVEIAPTVSRSAVEYGPNVLDFLDAKLKS